MDVCWKCRMPTTTLQLSQPITQGNGSREPRAAKVGLSHVGEKFTPHPG